MKSTTANLLVDMGMQPAIVKPGLAPSTQSTDTTPMKSTIFTPSGLEAQCAQ